MSQFYVISSGGGGEGITQLVPDEGGAISSTSVNILGQTSGVSLTPVMQTRNDGGTFFIENRTWDTPYVVDVNADPGERGTYTTIQAALDAAKVDGMLFSNPKKILLRNGSYTENLTIHDGAFFSGNMIDSLPGVTVCTITGNHTLPGAVSVTAYQGVKLSSLSSGSLFTGANALTYVTFNTCELNEQSSVDSDTMFNVTGNSIISAENCLFTCFDYDSGVEGKIKLDANNGMTFINCSFVALGIENTAGRIDLNNCTNLGNVISSTLITAETCQFITDQDYNIESPQGNFNNCIFYNSSGGQSFNNGVFSITNCYLDPDNPIEFFSPTATYKASLSTAGNVLLGERTDSNSQAGDTGYLGVTDTSSARTISINHITVDQEVVIADESGAAATNNITVQDFAGGLINGAASVVINANFGVVKFHAIPGGNWIIISKSF